MIAFGPIEKLGTIWWFEIFDAREEDTKKIESRIIEVIDNFEANYSRFISNSYVSILNSTRVLPDPSSEMLDMCNVAFSAYDATQGVFNVAVGDYLEKTGYDSNYSFRSQETSTIPDLRNAISFSKKEIKLNLENAGLDFGGLGKGYLIDRLASVLQDEFGIKYFLINGGGDMYVTSEHGKPITIALQDPSTGKNIGTTQIQNQGFASSSPVLRQWVDQEGVRHDHLVISQTTNNKETVYVTALSATQADIWATSLSIEPKLIPPEYVTKILP